MPKKEMLLAKTATVVGTSKMTVTKSILAGIGIISAAVLVVTFLAAIFSPLTVKSLQTRPLVNLIDVSLNKNTAPAQTIPRFVKDFEFIKFNIQNNSQQKVMINSFYLNKLGTVADRNIGELQLYDNSKLLMSVPRVEDNRVHFKDMNLALEVSELKTLALKATILLANSQPEGTIGFSINNNSLEVNPPQISKFLLAKEARGNLMKMKNK